MRQVLGRRCTSIAGRSLWLGLILLSVGACISPERPAAVRPHLAAISVSDLSASIEWYEQILGFELESNESYPDYNVSVAMLDIPGFRLELVEHALGVAPRPFMPDSTNPATLHGFVKLAFWVEDYTSTVERVQSEGMDFLSEPSTPTDGMSSFILLDPSGNWIQVFGLTGRP